LFKSEKNTKSGARLLELLTILGYSQKHLIV